MAGEVCLYQGARFRAQAVVAAPVPAPAVAMAIAIAIVIVIVIVIVIALGGCSRSEQPNANAPPRDEQTSRRSAASAPTAPPAASAPAARKKRIRTSDPPEGWAPGYTCPELDAAGVAANAAAAKVEPSALVPIKAGLTLTHVWNRGGEEFDHECLTQVVAVTDDYVDVTVSCSAGRGERNPPRKRRICRADMRSSDSYLPSTGEKVPLVVAPATMFTLSTRSLHELKTGATTYHRWLELDHDWEFGFKIFRTDIDGDLRVTSLKPATYELLVNDKVVTLPVVPATTRQPDSESDEFTLNATVLDDERAPLLLDYEAAGQGFRIRYTKVSYAAATELEQQLAADKPVDVYGIYFDFASDVLRPESTPVLEEIAAVLARNPDWKLSIAGHTDNIGGDTSNFELSRQRAAAVKAALVESYHIAPERLNTSGYGASSPQATNETPEGRARNRRVQLTRQ